MGAPVGAVLLERREELAADRGRRRDHCRCDCRTSALFRHERRRGRRFGSLSANLRYGRADAEAVVRYAEASADIVALQGHTPAALARLEAGLRPAVPPGAARDGRARWRRTVEPPPDQ